MLIRGQKQQPRINTNQTRKKLVLIRANSWTKQDHESTLIKHEKILVLIRANSWTKTRPRINTNQTRKKISVNSCQFVDKNNNHESTLIQHEKNISVN